VSVEPDAIFIRDDDVYTSAGVSAGIDLALALVEDDHGADLVRDVARSLVVFLKRAGGQSQFSAAVEAKPPKRSSLRAVTDAIAANPAANHSVKALATQASLSTRQLTRLFQTELGTTPARYVEAMRIDAARAALDAGSSVGDAARSAGFGSPETLRRVFVSDSASPRKAYRDRFRTTALGRRRDQRDCQVLFCGCARSACV
jgi:transcriptional regulator GlxA family with amidase domain